MIDHDTCAVCGGPITFSDYVSFMKDGRIRHIICGGPPRDLVALVRELIDILESVESTDEGREFHPTTIQTCRCMVAERLGILMPAITKLVK